MRLELYTKPDVIELVRLYESLLKNMLKRSDIHKFLLEVRDIEYISSKFSYDINPVFGIVVLFEKIFIIIPRLLAENAFC